MIQFALVALVAALVSGLGGILYGVGLGEDREIAKQAALEVVAEKAASLVAGQAVDAIGKIRGQRSTVIQKATHEVQTNTVYADCKLTPGLFNSINEALTGTGANPGTATGLPQTDLADRSAVRLGGTEANRTGFHLPGMSPVNRN